MLNVIAYIVSLAAIYSIAAVPLNLLQGYAGLLSLSLGATFGLGAYGTAIGMLKLNLPFLAALIAGVILAVVLQMVMAYPTLRLADLYFVLGTLAFQFIITSIMENWQPVTGGAAGLFGLLPPTLFGWDLASPAAYALVICLFAALCMGCTHMVAHSAFGLSIRGIRDDAIAMQALGHEVRGQKVLVAAYFAAWAGLAGGLYAGLLLSVNPIPFGFDQSVLMQAFIIVGGSGGIWGPVLGVSLLTVFPEVLRYIGIAGGHAPTVRQILYGALLVVIMRYRPQGILGERPGDAGWSWAAPGKRKGKGGDRPDRTGHSPAAEIARPAKALAATATGHAPRGMAGGEPGVLLEVKAVGVRFGGLQALENVNLVVREGAITGLIGPNGAGKSTLFNVITGFLRPDTGRVLLRGADIGALTPKQRVARRVARTFQELRLFDSLTVRQNIVLGMTGRHEGTENRPDQIRAETERLVNFFGLRSVADTEVRNLSYGEQKLVSIARVVATRCELLLLDEPTSGLDARQIDELLPLLKELVIRGCTICIIEHNMDIIRTLADDVYVLHHGQNIAGGHPAEVLEHPRVLEVYLGT